MTALIVVTPATSEPIGLDEARAQCRVTAHDEDALIAGYIMRAREHVETVLARTLITTTYDLKLDPEDGAWPSSIQLPRPPLQSITSVTYVDGNGATQTLASNQYQVTGINDRHRNGVIVPAYQVTWPVLRDQPEAITVRFVAGYTFTPQPIKQALLLLVEHYFAHRGPFLSGTIGQPIPYSVEDLLFPWRSFQS